MVKTITLFETLLLVFYYVETINSMRSPISSDNDLEYAFYFPRSVIAEQLVTGCLTISESHLPVTLELNFHHLQKRSTFQVNEAYWCGQIKVPSLSIWTNTTELLIKISPNHRNDVYESRRKIQITSEREVVFIETDRDIYKAGDVVKIRMLVLGVDLKPPLSYQIPSVKIVTPSKITVASWYNVTTELGLVQLEFQLAPETEEGQWVISSTIIKSFEVKKYVLPRFRVNIVAPTEVYIGEKEIPVSVCGKYSYSKNVEGSAFLKESSSPYGPPYYPYTALSAIEPAIMTLTNGCAKFVIPPQIIQSGSPTLGLEASITEIGTNQVEVSSIQINIHTRPFALSLVTKYYKTGLPFIGKVKISDISVNITDEPFEVCYVVEQYLDSVCANVSVSTDNTLHFTFPPFKNNIGYVEISVRSLTYPDVDIYESILPWQSISDNFLQIKQLYNQQDSRECGSNVDFTVMYTSKDLQYNKNITFYYIILTDEGIFYSQKITQSAKKNYLNLKDYSPFVSNITEYLSTENSVDEFVFSIKITNEFYHNTKLVVHYTYNKEVIADEIKIVTANCYRKIFASWTKSTLYPGETNTLSITSAYNNSLCAISAIDEASTYLKASNPMDIEQMWTHWNRDSHYIDESLNCNMPEHHIHTYEEMQLQLGSPSSFDPVQPPAYYPGGPAGYYPPPSPSPYPPSSPPPYPPPSPSLYPNTWKGVDAYDSYDVFKSAGILVFTNLRFISKNCTSTYEPSGPYNLNNQPSPHPALYPIGTYSVGMPAIGSYYTVGMSGSAEAPLAKNVGYDNRGSIIRSFFPETWLWDLVPLRSHSIKLEKQLPDSITNWVTNVVCISSDNGIGMSDAFEVHSFKPFFVDMLVPYSVKRNIETLLLPVKVFNYVNQSLAIRISLKESEGIELSGIEKDNNKILSIQADSSYTHYYPLKATKLGRINLTVEAFVVELSEDMHTFPKDIVQKEILVESEGYSRNIFKSILLCGNTTAVVDKTKWTITLPNNTVSDSISGKIIINSDLFGPTYQNLENILEVPSGCGEQIMATLSPNLYVLKYLQATNGLDDNIKTKILNNLQIGYQRILAYRQPDGGFSAFGFYSHQSTYLTAFVLHILTQMAEYIPVDNTILLEGQRWLMQQQMLDGCFNPLDHVFHRGHSRPRVALTAYVLISLLETKSNISPRAMFKAKMCLLRDNSNDQYSLALRAYAFLLMNATIKANTLLNKLMDVAKDNNGMTWWDEPDYPSSSILISSYVSMTLLHQGSRESISVAASVIRWLQSEMRPRGGFYTSVDTVAALDAISRYISLISREEPNLTVSVGVNGINKEFSIVKRNQNNNEIVSLTSYPSTVDLEAYGTGCALVQAAVSFNVKEVVNNIGFTISVSATPPYPPGDCSIEVITPCISYTHSEQSGMILAEITMPSGYVSDAVSLHELMHTKVINKFEHVDNKVVFYFTKLTKIPVCVPFKIMRSIVVTNIANSTIKVYDYYNPSISSVNSFKVGNCMHSQFQYI